MAGHGNCYRSHNTYDGFDPWKAESSHDSEQLCCPALDESEGRRMIAVDAYQNPGTIVMKTETTVESVHPSMFSEIYGQCSPPRYEHHPHYGVVNHKLHRPSIPSNDWPPVVEELLLVAEELFNIQNEVSQPSGFDATRAPYQLSIPVSACYYGTTGNAGDSDHEKERHKPITKTIKDKGRKAEKILKPPVTTEGGNRPRRGHPTGSMLPSHHISPERERTIQPPSTIVAGRQERRVPNMELSKPMTDIDTAMEYFKKVVDLSSVNTIKDEVPDRGHSKGDKIPKLPVATEGAPAVRPGHPTEPILPNNYISSERGERTIQPLSMTMTGGRERRGHVMGLEPMNETGKMMEFSKEAVKPWSGNKVPQKDSIPETIDSKEARRRYGNIKSSPEMNSPVDTITIDSREAARKYGGVFVRNQDLD